MNSNMMRSGYMQSDDYINGVMAKPSNMRAAEYVRMSTEHQQYSTQNQNEKIREFAAQRGIEIGLRRQAKSVGQHGAAHQQSQQGPDRRRRNQAGR